MALIVGGTKKAASALRWLWPAWASAMIAAITVMALVTGVLPGQRLVVADDATSGLAFRSQVGRVATFVCPSTLLANGTIWGTDRYLDESPVCTAAIHAGALTRGTSAQVTILMSADGQSFRGTARNGVTSLNYGPWESSYTFVKTGQPGQIDWATTLDRIPDDFRTPIKLSCPPKGSTDFEVSGTDVYTSQSAICVAAVHAGVITRDGGGAISVIPVVKQASFPATTRNGVTTTSWVDPIWQSYPQPFRVASISTAVRVPTSAPAVGTVGAVAPVPAGRRGMPAAAVLDDATAPTVTVTTVPAGLQISYDLVPGAINYVLCRESPPASTLCDPITTGGVSVLGNTASQFDLGLTPGSAYAYRVRAVRPDQHFGESAPVTGKAGGLPTPTTFRVVKVNSSPAEIVLEWDPVQYVDYTGPRALTTYELSGGGLLSARIVNGTQAAVPIFGWGPLKWQLVAIIPAQGGGRLSSVPATLDYVMSYRLVALGMFVQRDTRDDVLTFDGAGDEVYLAWLVNATNLDLSSSIVTTGKSATFGDVAGFPNRVRAGSVSATGGLTGGDVVPPGLDIAAPAVPSAASFPLPLWEGPIDDFAMVVVHPVLWEEDKGINPYRAWVSRMSVVANSGYPSFPDTRSGIRLLQGTDALGPGSSNHEAAGCFVGLRLFSEYCVAGEDRPIGLGPFSANEYQLDDRFVVLTRRSIEKSLLLPASPQGKPGKANFTPTGPGIIPLLFEDVMSSEPFGYGRYTVYLRVERVP